MNFVFTAMNEEFARDMLKNWRFDGVYSVYDYTEEELFEDRDSWGKGKFAVLSEDKKLVGELTIEFFEVLDGVEKYIAHSDVIQNPNNNYEMWLGWGFKEQMESKEEAQNFIDSCINYAVDKYNYGGEYVMCAVGEFNKEAVELYISLGFEVFHMEEDDEKSRVLWLRKKIQ